MRIAFSWGIRLVAAVMLLLAQGLFYRPGEALAQGSLRQLTESADPYETYGYPTISADGTRIAFCSGLCREIYVVHSDGTGLRRLVGGNLQPLSPPSISADGQWIAFVAKDTTRATFRYAGDVYVMRTDGTALRQLTTSPKPGEQYLEEDKHLWGERYMPAISGDGSLVVFSSNASFTRQNEDQNRELFAVRTDGTGLRQLTNTANARQGNLLRIVEAHSPAVDYYGARVAFFLTGPGQGAQAIVDPPDVRDTQYLYVVNTDGSGLRELSVATYGGVDVQVRAGWGPAISGDGSLVAFWAQIRAESGSPIEGGFYIVKADGTGLRRWSGVEVPRFPSLTFDGSRIAFAHYYYVVYATVGFGSWEVFVANADGSGLTRLTTTPHTPASPPVGGSGREGVALSADGTHVAFASTADLLEKNDDHSQEIYVRRVNSLVPVQGVRNQRLAADLEKNRFSLVARRDLVVRAFFDTGVGGTSHSVRGRLVVDEGTPQQATFEAPYIARPLGYFDNDPEARLRLEDSLNFFITGQQADRLLTPGVHTFKVRVELGLDIFAAGEASKDAAAPADRAGPGRQTAASFEPWEETFQATFRQPDTVDVFIIPVRVRDAAGALVSPDAALLNGASDFLRATYPVDESRDRVRNIVLAPLELNQAPNIFPLDRILALGIWSRLQAQLLWGLVPNPARHNFIAALLPNTVDGLNPIGGDLGYTYPDIRGAVVSLDRDSVAPNPPVIGSTIAHEVGHQLGLGDEYTSPDAHPSVNNPPPATAADGDVNGNYVLEIAGGLDTANRRAVFNRPGAVVRGYMGAGNDQNSWATGIDYAYLYSRVTTDTVGGSQAVAAALTRFINVSGVITRTGGIQLNPFLVATSPYTFTRPSGTQYSFQFKGAGGAVLDTVSFNVGFTKEVRGVGHLPVDAAPFSFTVPLPEGVASMVVLTGTTPMITHTVSARPPTVTVLAPNGGETLRETAQVRWQASDPDGDALTYTVLYSPNSTDRYVVATNLATTTLDLDFSQVPRGDRAYVIVRANDGFNYAEDASDGPLVAGPWRVFVPLVAKAEAGGW